MSGAAPDGDPRPGRSAALPVSRALLFPGPMAPLSHFGATLQRHVVASGLRYALYQLGLPPPEKPPVRIHRLRLYLDGPALERWLDEQPGGREIAAALVDPGGVAGRRGGLSAAPSSGRRLAGAAAFHRLRLRLTDAWRDRRPARPLPPAEVSWASLRAALSARLPALNDAFLGELLASLARRRRDGGRETAPCLGREAWRWSAGRRARLDHLGPPDPIAGSWATEPPETLAISPADVLPPRHPHRGRFRERYRATLDALRPAILEIARRAHGRALLDSPGDAYFLPFDLGDHLELETPPSWLRPAVETNRREYEALLAAPCPPDLLAAELAQLAAGDDRRAWAAQPLMPLP